MNIVFMGTPDFAIPSLNKILNSKHNIAAIVTSPDKERGRGQKVSFTPVKEFAVDNKIPVLQPSSLKDEHFADSLKEINADLFVVVAFKILPPSVFNIPSKGSFNLHGSLLPKYRGAAPIQWALMNGEEKTGVTTFKLAEKVDTGNMYLQREIKIEDSDDFGSLHDKLSLLGAEVVADTIDIIDSGDFILLPQNNELASPAPKITKDTGRIDWNSPAYSIHNLIRGLSPFPGAYFYYDGVQIKIYKSEVVEDKLNPGEVHQTKNELIIGCSDKSLKILELQKEGKKRLNTGDFLRGFNFK